jgi:L-ascorbate metabolism protein UlaG (beta-lactamase superfamily)
MTASTLMQRFARIESGPGQAAIWWLGQAGFLVRVGGVSALLDPFLAPHEGRRFESMLEPSDAADIDVILCSHEHIDHFDAKSVPGLAEANPGALIVVPTPIVSMVTDLGIDAGRVVGAQPGDPIELGAIRIHPVPARHGVEITDAYTFGTELSDGLVRYLGFVVEADGVRIYHAGDTILYEGMADTLRDIGVDVALLPINGRDGYREAQGLVGNLTEHEAAILASEMGADVLIPTHYELFPHNRGYPARVLDTVDREDLPISVSIPNRRNPFVYTGPAEREHVRST